MQSSHFYTAFSIWVFVRPILRLSPCTVVFLSYFQYFYFCIHYFCIFQKSKKVKFWNPLMNKQTKRNTYRILFHSIRMGFSMNKTANANDNTSHDQKWCSLFCVILWNYNLTEMSNENFEADLAHSVGAIFLTAKGHQ